jgi:DNA-binding MarR family transcriptional regulator
MEHPDPKRVDEYTVLVKARKVTDGHRLLSARQSEILVALAQPILEAGARFADLETYTQLPKATISTVITALMKRRLVNRSKANIFSLSENGQAMARGLIDAAENLPENSIEPTLNSTPLNWQIENENSSDTTPLVRAGSTVVQSLFSEPFQFSSFASPSLREATTELNEAEPMGHLPNGRTGRGLL